MRRVRSLKEHFVVPYRSLFFLLLVFVGACQTGRPRDVLSSPRTSKSSLKEGYRQITTYPADETHPVCTRTHLYFSSNRRGNNDIWAYALSERTTRLLDDATAADTRPTLARNSHDFAFVSTREDANGDIWIAHLRSSKKEESLYKLRKYTDQTSFDTHPRFSPEGKHLVYTRGIGAQRTLWVGQVQHNQKAYALTSGQSFNADWSSLGTIVFVRPDSLQGGTALYTTTLKGDEKLLTARGWLDVDPVWSPDGEEVAFCRRSCDTDNNGSINLADNAALWVYHIATGDERQLTDYGAMATSPAWSFDGRLLYFSSNRKGNNDIWAVPAQGAVPTCTNVKAQFALAEEPLDDPWMQILRYAAVVNRYDNNQMRGRALRAAADLYYRLGLSHKGAALLEQVHQSASTAYEECGLAMVTQIMNDTLEMIPEKIALFEKVQQEYLEIPSVCAAALLQQGVLLAQSGDDDRALIVLEKIINEYSSYQLITAQARLLTGDIYARFGNSEQVLATWISVSDDYYTLPSILSEVADKIIMLLAGEGSGMDAVEVLRPLVERFREDSAPLAALVQLRIAHHLYDAGYVADAGAVCSDAAQLQERRGMDAGEALLQGARMYQYAGDLVKAERMYRALLSHKKVVIADAARQNLLRLLTVHGEALLEERDVQFAQSRFMAAATIDYGSARAHRGLIDCYAARGKVEEIATKYKNRLYYHPQSAIDHYAFGYATVYLADKVYGKKLKRLYVQALKHLDLARRYQPNLVYAYLTLGYVYEMMEQRGVGKGELLFERAIETQRMGLALNDGQTAPLLEADFCQNLANNHEKLGMYDEAVKYYQRALKQHIYFRAPLQKLLFYRNLGVCLHRLDRHADAITWYRNAFELADSLDKPQWSIKLAGRIALARKEQAELARQTARMYEQKGDFERAKDMLDLADKRYDRANAYNRIALTMSKEMQISEAEPLRHALQQNSSKRDIAFNMRQLGEFEHAVRYAREAQSIIDYGLITEKTDPNASKVLIKLFGFIPLRFKAPDFTIGGSHASEGFPLYMQSALNYTVIGQSMVQQGDYQGALYAFKKKQELYQQKQDPTGESVIYNNIGFLYYHLNKPDSAALSFAASGALCHGHGFVFGERTALLNQSLLCIEALAHAHNELDTIAQKDILQGIQWAAQGLSLCQTKRDSLVFDNTAGVLYLYAARALKKGLMHVEGDVRTRKVLNTFLHTTWLTRSLYFFERGMRGAQNGGYRRYALRITGNIAVVQSALGYIDIARKLLVEARQKAHQHVFREEEWRLTHSLAVLSNSDEERDHNAEALLYYREAIDLMEAQPQGSAYTELATGKSHFLNEMEGGGRSKILLRQQAYNDIIRLLMGKNDYIAALTYAERHRVMAAADMLCMNGLPFLKKSLGRALDRNFLGWIIAYEDDLSRQELNFHRALYKNESFDALKVGVNASRQRLHKHIVAEEEKNGSVVSLIRPRTVSLDKLQGTLDERTALIMYALHKDILHIWVVDQQGVNAQTVVNVAGIPDMVRSFRELISKEEDISRINAAAGALYIHLMAPIEAALEGHDRLVFLPGPDLYALPFSALHDGNEYIAQKYSVSMVPSMASWFDSYQQRNVNKRRMLTVSDDDSLEVLQQLPESIIDHTFLPASLTTETSLKATLENYDIIHLETPATMGVQPLFAALTFVEDDSSDGTLHFYELLKYRLRASLLKVVFMDSESALGRDEWVLLASIARYCGVPSLIHNLWVENTQLRWQANELFYTYAAQYPFDDALTEVKLDLMKENSHPRHWAGMRLVGFSGMSQQQMYVFASERFNRVVQLGVAAQKRKKWDDAYRYFSIASSMARELKKTKMMPKIEAALVTYAYRMGDFKKALYHQRQLLKLASSSVEEARALRKLARFSTADKQYKRALVYEQQYRSCMRNSVVAVAGSYLESAGIMLADGAYKDALVVSDSACTLFKQIQDPTAGDAALLSIRILLEQAHYTLALKRLEPLCGTYTDSMSSQYAQAFQFSGFSLEKLGDYEAAIVKQQQALDAMPKDKNDHLRTRSHQNLANSYWYKGDLNAAVRHQRIALDRARQTGSSAQEILALSTFGLINLSLGRPVEALKMEKQALLLAQKTGASDGEAATHNNMGLVFRYQEEEAIALTHFKKALQIDRKANQTRGIASDYRNIAISYERMGDYVRAHTYLNKSLEISRVTENRENEVKVLYSLGTVATAIGENSAALKYLIEALSGAEELGLQDIRWRALRRLGLLHIAAGEKQAAADKFVAALEIVESMRAGLKIEAYKTGFMDDKLDVYQDMILLLLDDGKNAEALSIAERAKSRNFLDLLGTREIQFSDTLRNRLALEERDLKRRIGSAVRKVTMVDIDRHEAEETVAVLKKEYRELLIRMREENPHLASIVSIAPASAYEVQNLLAEDVALLEYFQTNEQLVIWCVTREAIVVQTVPISETQLNTHISSLRDAIRTLSPVEDESKKLYAFLIAPLEKELTGISKLCIVPHGGLHYLPYAALQDAQGTYLLERFTLFNSPSASILRHCLTADNRTRNSLLALGNPDLSNARLDLPFAQKEVESIQWQYPNNKIFLRGEVTESHVREYASGYDIIHFACHGEFDNDNPLFSALLLTPDAEDDGRLEVNEIFSLKLNASLITLSACETGLGKIEKGDDVVGLTRAFIVAGTPAIVASLWKISDVASAVLIKRFYRYLKNEGAADALRRAQLFIKEKYRHPAYWASFTLSGDYR